MKNHDQNPRPRRAMFATALVAVIVSTSLATTGAMAEGPPRGGERLDQMAGALDLSSDQRDQVEAILRDMHAQRQSVLETSPADRRQMQDAMRSLREGTRARLSAVLTPAQLESFDELQAQRRQHGQARGDDRRDGRFERLATELELHASQEAPVREIMQRSREEARGIMEAGREQGMRREEVKADLDALRERTHGELAGILTPAQLSELEELESRRRAQREGWRQQRREGGREGGHPGGQGRDDHR